MEEVTIVNSSHAQWTEKLQILFGNFKAAFLRTIPFFLVPDLAGECTVFDLKLL